MKLSDLLRQSPLIAILRRIPEEKIPFCAETFAARGGKFLELTFDPADPATLRTTGNAIRELRKNFPTLHIGAGTVLTSSMAETAAEAGAEFLVSPATSRNVIETARKHGIAAIPGAFTPNEILAAWEAGADLVKLFPILPGGEQYVKTVMAPLAHIPFLVTGGVNPSTARSMLETGAVAIGAGASLFPPDQVARNEWSAIGRQIELLFREINNHGSEGEKTECTKSG